MGCALLEPLLNEAVKKEKSCDHCQAALTHLTRVGVQFIRSLGILKVLKFYIIDIERQM